MTGDPDIPTEQLHEIDRPLTVDTDRQGRLVTRGELVAAMGMIGSVLATQSQAIDHLILGTTEEALDALRRSRGLLVEAIVSFQNLVMLPEGDDDAR